MSGIWAVKNDENNGMVKMQKLSTVSQQIDFTHMMMSMGNADVAGSSVPLAEKIADMPPTRDNVEEIASYMQGRIEKAFRDAGVAYDPEVRFALNPDGSLEVYGDRSDMEKVKSIFANDDALADDMKTFINFADQMPAYERNLEYQIKLANAETDAERDALKEEYADLFDGKDHYDTTAAFSAQGFQAESQFME